jgi:CheY-like chemotaxis protein
VLIVEDDADAREALRSLLEIWGHEVVVAENGDQGIELTLTRRPEVVLLDIAMPGMDGYEVARRIRRAPGGDEPYLVALTGWGRVEDHRLARAAGFDTYVLKPADPEHLQALLAAAPTEHEDGQDREPSR